MQAGVGAVIASVVFDMGEGIVRSKNTGSVLIMFGAFAASCIFDVNVVCIVISCLLIGVVRTLINERRNKR